MKIPEVNSCCCGCTVRTGTLILLWLGVVGGIISALGSLAGDPEKHIEPSFPTFLAKLIFVVAFSVSGLYAVYKRKPVFLIPILIIHAIGIAGMLLLVLIVFLLMLFGQDQIVTIIQTMQQEAHSQITPAKTIRDAVIMFGVIYIIIMLIFAALEAYFAIVQYSYYLRLKEETRTNNVAYGGTAQSKAEQGQGGYYPPPYAQPTAQ